MAYVDGYVLPIKKKNLAAYKRIASKAGKIWREHGALEYKECVGEDLAIKGVRSFSKAALAGRGETVVFAYVVFKSRKHRDTVNARVMKDPRIQKMCNDQTVPFDMKKLCYGGFKVMVDPK